MSTTLTTTDTTTKNIPFLSEPIVTLFQRDELFAGIADAQDWFDQFSTKVLKDPALDVVYNLLGAASAERRNRGLLTLERAILAQAAWLQLWDLMVPAKQYDQLLVITRAVRDADASMEDYTTAKQAVVDAFEKYTARKAKMEAEAAARKEEVDPLIAKIIDLASERDFIDAARAGAIHGNGNRTMGLCSWQVTVLDAVLDDKGAREAPKSLRLTAERLEFLSKVHFGELPTRNGGSTKKGRSAAKVAKSARDSALREQMRGKKG